MDLATRRAMTDLCHYLKATLSITAPNFGPEIATVYTQGRYTQQSIVCTDFKERIP